MTQPQHDAREGDGDPQHDPAALGEEQFAAPDGDGGALPPDEAERATQDPGSPAQR